ncbi:YeeE/YedE family protein [Arenibaculum pallidiluteum]|uniref:YeeE/YedE family protein n=1 Tax=Arenibaculum pallidiluteum TaxID=2812559 RepID=UPI001A96B484|nr:YeeE/YedE family protein [Arenibaculum pallidiluteum]
MTDIALSQPGAGLARGRNLGAAGIAALLLALGALWLADTVTGRQAALFLVGGALGLVLYHASFGFTSAFRVLIADRRGAGLRAQMVMLAVASVLFFPVLAAGTLFGVPVKGLVSPAGVSVVAGAFLFGIGMQLGGGCASGTLFTVGGGNTRMLVTLAAFIVGSVLGAFHLPWWQALPSLGPVSLIDGLGWPAALALNLAVFAAVAGLSVLIEKRYHGRLVTDGAAGGAAGGAGARSGGLASRLLRGPWPLVWGAVALALLNFATLALAGRPWGITSAFALWGSKALMATGVDVASWPFWQAPANAKALQAGVLEDVTSVMDFGIILGALLAAGLAGRFAPGWRLPLRSLAAAIVGGLLLGYGSRLAFGCNIGAYFSGIASGSLHGWVWIVAALAGNWIGTGLRPAFGLAVERTPRLTGC